MRTKATSLLLAATTLLAVSATAQTTYLQLGQEDYHLLDRLETRSGELSNNLFLAMKPVSRKGAVSFLEEQKENARNIGLSSIDRYNIGRAISVSGEWAEDEDGAIDSKTPIFNAFYKKQPDLLHINTDNFFLVVNPVISVIGIGEQNNPNGLLFSSSRGVELRGWIAKKIGFYTYFTDNQETMPSFADSWSQRYNAVPGADYYTGFSGGKYDYLLARGYIDFAAVKDHVNVTLGYDKHFLGDGMRSLFLSDFSAGATFLRLNTRIWKLNYQNLYMELTPQIPRGPNRVYPHKYATMHMLSVNATKWLNIGLFESVIFNRRDRYEFSYMIPLILYRQVERSLGSPDNVLLGINFKAIAAKHLQFYGQFMLDEFTAKEVFGGNGYWANKFGLQLGGKYFDAFSVRNLDLQGEVNLVRPFTYSHFDSTGNYSHYNQPLAHPLGAGFAEILGLIRYQPVRDLYISVKGMYYNQGVDSTGTNFGSDIFRDYDSRSMDYGVGLINGVRVQCAALNLTLSYELRENLFIDLGATHRRYVYEAGTTPNATTTYGYGGLRLNIARRDYDFY